LLTHTQVLTPDIAKLVEPRPAAFAAAIAELIARPDERARLSMAAKLVAQEKYSRESYLRRTAQAYRMLVPGAPGTPVAPDAPVVSGALVAPVAPAAPVAPVAPAKELARS